MSLPIVAIIGRPNVGKSTFFNRLTGRRTAITDDTPGVTRDRLYGRVEWLEKRFLLIDTGGFVPRSEEHFERKIREQAEIAIEESDLVLFMVDAQVGPAELDLDIARILRKTGKTTFLLANKADNEHLELESSRFYSLGLGDPIAVSSISGRNIADFLDQVTAALPEFNEVEESEPSIKIAVVGRPNVGKSSLVNKLLGDERLIVSEIPGTTRDSIDTEINYSGRKFVLIDTAGLRRRAKVQDHLEFFTTLRTMRALERADLAIVLIDAVDGVTVQDIKIIEQAEEVRKGILLVVNKWDIVEKESRTADLFAQAFYERAPMMNYIPLVFVSALTGQRVTRTLDLSMEIHEERLKRITTAELNDFLRETVSKRTPPAHAGRFIKFYYVTQTDVAPPTFVFFVNYPQNLDRSYLRYLENQLREKFGFKGNSVRMKFKKRISKAKDTTK